MHSHAQLDEKADETFASRYCVMSEKTANEVTNFGHDV